MFLVSFETYPYWPVIWSISDQRCKEVDRVHSSDVDTTRRPASSFLDAKIMNSTKTEVDSHRNGDFKMIASRYTTVREEVLLSRAHLLRTAYRMIAGLDSRLNLVVRMPRSACDHTHFHQWRRTDLFDSSAITLQHPE